VSATRYGFSIQPEPIDQGYNAPSDYKQVPNDVNDLEHGVPVSVAMMGAFRREPKV